MFPISYLSQSEMENYSNTSISQNCWRKKYNYCTTDGKVLWSGSQQLRATTPANLCWQVKAVYKDKAPPWKEWIQKKGWVLKLFNYNVIMLRQKVWPEKNHQGLYGEGGSHFWPHVQLRPLLEGNIKTYALPNIIRELCDKDVMKSGSVMAETSCFLLTGKIR